MLRCGTTVGVPFVDAWFMSNHRWRWGVLGVCGLAVLVYLRSDWLRYFFSFLCLNMFVCVFILWLLRWLWSIRSSLTCCGILFSFLDVFLTITDISLVSPPKAIHRLGDEFQSVWFVFYSKIRVSETFHLSTCAIRLVKNRNQSYYALEAKESFK